MSQIPKRRPGMFLGLTVVALVLAPLGAGADDPRSELLSASQAGVRARLDESERAVAAGATAAPNDVRTALEVVSTWSHYANLPETMDPALRRLPTAGDGAPVVGDPQIAERESLARIDTLIADAETLRAGRSSFGPLNNLNLAIIQERLAALARLRAHIAQQVDQRLARESGQNEILATVLTPGQGIDVLAGLAQEADTRMRRAGPAWDQARAAHAKEYPALLDLWRRESLVPRAQRLEAAAERLAEGAGGGTLGLLLLYGLTEDSDAHLGLAPGRKINVRCVEHYGLRQGTSEQMTTLAANLAKETVSQWTARPHPVSSAPHHYRRQVRIIALRTGLTESERARALETLHGAMRDVMGPTVVPPMNCPGPINELYYPMSLPADWVR